MFNFKLKNPLLLAGLLAFGVSAAQASIVEPYLDPGSNVFEDDSNEYIFRPNTSGGYDLLASGSPAVGDLVFSLYDFPIINGTNIDSAGIEVTGIGIYEITSISAGTDVVDIDGPGPAPAVTVYDQVTYGAASATDWLALTGIDITAFSWDETGLMALIYEDTANNFSYITDGLADGADANSTPDGIDDTTDGTLLFGLGLQDGTDYAVSLDSPIDIATYLPSAGEIPGVTQYGTFSYEMSVAYESLGGTIVSDISGSGTNLVTNTPVAGIIDDTQFSFNYVPEPGILTLIGAGLLGLGGFSRRRTV
jgi:hypothetical protein